MADRGRDLKFAILSDVARFDLDQPARDLDDLGDAAELAGRILDDLTRDSDRTARTVDDLGDDARRAAGKVDDAFDTIARASRRSERRLDDDTDKMRDSLRDVGDEAGSTAREMAASFSESGDIGDAFQELAANAPAALGAVGLAAGAAAAVGVGLIRAEAEKVKELANDFADDILEAGGRITAAAVDERIKAMATDDADALIRLRDAAEEAGLSVRDVIRAKAGDAEAAERVAAEIERLNEQYEGTSIAAGTLTNEQFKQQAAASEVSREVGVTTRALKLAKDATRAATDATREADVAARDAADGFDYLRGNAGKPIRAKVTVDAPSRDELDDIRRRIAAQMGTIVVPVRAGQTRYSNTADNSRYRW